VEALDAMIEAMRQRSLANEAILLEDHSESDEDEDEDENEDEN